MQLSSSVFKFTDQSQWLMSVFMLSNMRACVCVCVCGLMKLIYIAPCYAKGCGIEGEFALPRVYKEDPEGD